MNKKRRDLLIALLRDLPGAVEDIDVSGFSPEDKLFMAVAAASDLIVAGIVLAAKKREDALLGIENLVSLLKRKIEEHPYGNEHKN